MSWTPLLARLTSAWHMASVRLAGRICVLVFLSRLSIPLVCLSYFPLAWLIWNVRFRSLLWLALSFSVSRSTGRRGCLHKLPELLILLWHSRFLYLSFQRRATWWQLLHTVAFLLATICVLEPLFMPRCSRGCSTRVGPHRLKFRIETWGVRRDPGCA